MDIIPQDWHRDVCTHVRKHGEDACVCLDTPHMTIASCPSLSLPTCHAPMRPPCRLPPGAKARVVQAGMAVQGRAKDVWTPEVAQAFGALIRELA